MRKTLGGRLVDEIITEEKEAMRKTFLIGVLAALMLFAFTACEQNMPSTPLYGAQVESITVAEQPVYIVMPSLTNVTDTIDPSVIKFAVKYNDGKVYTYTGAQLGLTAASVNGGATVNALTKTITVKLDEDGKYTFYPQVKAYEPTAAVIDLASIENQPVEIQKDKAVTYNVDVTVSSNGGAKVFEIPFKTLASDVNDIIKDNKLEAGDTFTVTAEYASNIAKHLTENPLLDITFEGSVSVIVVDGTETKIDHIVAKQNGTIYADITGMAGNKTLTQASITVTAYDKDGNVLSGNDITGFTTSVYDENNVKFNDAYTWKKAGTYKVTVKYANADGSKSFSYPMELKISEDYPIAFEVSQKNSETPVDGHFTEKYKYIPGEPITFDTSKFDMKVTAWKSNASTTYAEDDEPDYTVEWKASPSVIPYDITLSGTEGSKTGTYKINFETVIDGEVVTAQWASSDNGVTVVEKR